MGIYDALSWTREASEPSEELAELVRSHPEIFHSDLRIDPPTAIERYSNPRYRFESYGLQAGENPSILVTFSDIVDWVKGRANAIEYTLVETTSLGAGESILSVIGKWKRESWLPKLRYWFLIEPTDGRLSAKHGIRGAFKELIGREDMPQGITEAEQWDFLFEKYGVGKPGFEYTPYGSVAALGSIFLARSRYAALELQDSFSFGPR